MECSIWCCMDRHSRWMAGAAEVGERKGVVRKGHLHGLFSFHSHSSVLFTINIYSYYIILIFLINIKYLFSTPYFLYLTQFFFPKCVCLVWIGYYTPQALPTAYEKALNSGQPILCSYYNYQPFGVPNWNYSTSILLTNIWRY